jgi:hypothetical protein
MKTYTAGQLEAAFEFCRIVNERGGFRLSAEGRGEEEDVFYEFPDLTCLLNSPDDCEHLPLPPKKVMMQMWRNNSDDSLFSEESWKSFVTAEKVGEPFEFVFPEEVKK